MSEMAIGIGVHNPQERGELVARRFNVLISAIEELGYPSVLVGNNQKTAPAGIDQHVFLESAVPFVERSIDENEVVIGAIRDITGRLKEHTIPMVNEVAVREIAANKLKLSEILDGQTASTMLLPAGNNARTLLDNQPDHAAYIVKPVQGFAGSGVEKLTPAQLVQREFDVPMLVQPFMDTTHIPSSIVGQGEYHQVKLATTGVPKEVRIYGFRYPDGQVKMYPIVRVSGQEHTMDNSTFIAVEPESVPTAVYESTHKSLDRISAAAGVAHIFAGVDHFFDPTTEQPYVMEANVKEPYIPGQKLEREGEDDISRDARKALGRHVYSMVASHLVDVAKNNQA